MRTPAVYARAARKLVAVAMVVSLLTPFASARGAAACGTTTGQFTTISGPRFPSGAQRIIDLALDARTPSRFFVTNGTSVMRTNDGGCSWQAVYKLGPQPANGQTYTASNARIVKVVVPEAGGRVLLSIAETLVNQTRPHVLVSDNAGQSWQSGDAGLPPLGSPDALVVASSSPDIAYLAVDLGGGTIDSIYASSDGGHSWQPRAQRLGNEFEGFEVDPIVPTELWAYGNGLHHSTDGGATWIPVDDFVGIRTGPVDVFHARGKPSDLFVFVPELRTLKRSQDGGESWLDAYGLAAPSSVDHGRIPESRLATAGGNMWVWVPALFTWVDTRAPVEGLTDLNASRTTSPKYFMHNATQVVIYAGQTGRDYPVKHPDFAIGELSLVDPPPFVSPEPRLSPKEHIIKIPAGDKKRVTYDLALSKVRTPLDLYFLIDTSESALPFLRGLAYELQDLVNGLHAARIDVRFGLGEYRAYPDSTPPRPYCGSDDVPVVEDPQCERNFVYRQVLDFPESTAQALGSAISNLDPIAGGHYDASLPALYQTATGAGEDVWPYGGTSDSYVDGHDVSPGQQASYADKALKVVLIATDEGFVNKPYPRDDFPPDPPSTSDVIAELNKRDIKQIGLALGPEAAPDMRAVAAGTGAIAPAEGADCDGNGSAEIPAGAPLVCTVHRDTLEQGSNLVPAIVNTVEAVRDTEPVSLEVDAPDDVVASVTPGEYPGVVLQADEDLKFDVTYECPMSMAGERSKVSLSAMQSAKKLATATATVVCGKVDPTKEKKGFFATFPFDRVLGLLPLLPLAPPPTLTNPTSATQAQSQAQAQGAMAAQEQQQPQVAYAIQHKAKLAEALAREEQEYQMTSYRDRSKPVPGLFLAAGAVMMSAAYALAMSRRRRTELSYLRRR